MSELSEELLQWATPLQAEALKTTLELGSQKDAAEALGLPRQTLNDRLVRLRRNAAKRGYSPKHDMTKPVPDGYHVKGVSTLYNDQGEVTAQWVKSEADKTQWTLDNLKLAVDALIDPAKGKHVPGAYVLSGSDDLMNVFPIADAHMGMYAWAEETGEDFDADICSANLFETMEKLVAQAPPARTALIANLADFFHADTQENKTMRSGNILDVDTRWARVLQIGIKTYRSMIELALGTHETVVVKSAIGNHDDHSILVLALTMQAYFDNEPRVQIELPINPYVYHVFGNTLLGLNHFTKPDRLPGIMACDQREQWGKTRFHHWFVGHRHSQSFYEYPACTVEGLRSTSPKDSWTSSMGYRSERDMQVITYHREHGEVGRNRVSIY